MRCVEVVSYPFLSVVNCDCDPETESRSALILCTRVAFSLRSASVPQVLASVQLPTVAETSKPADTRAPTHYNQSRYINNCYLNSFLLDQIRFIQKIVLSLPAEILRPDLDMQSLWALLCFRLWLSQKHIIYLLEM